MANALTQRVPEWRYQRCLVLPCFAAIKDDREAPIARKLSLLRLNRNVRSRSQSRYEEASYNLSGCQLQEAPTELGIRIDVTKLRLDIGRTHDKSFRRPTR